jgi:hypothetical protein
LGKPAKWSSERKNYLGVTLESSGGWIKQKAKHKVKGIQSLVAIDKCLTRRLDVGVKLL